MKSEREKADELKKAIRDEKERRVRHLPRFRPEDQIDAEKEHIELFRDIFDALPRFEDREDAVETLDFFVALRKDPVIQRILTTLAREPSGVSRIPRETFAEVIDRLEHSEKEKFIEWPTIVEYFTKRGRPRTQEEIEAQLNEDANEEDVFNKEMDAKKKEEEKVLQEFHNIPTHTHKFTSMEEDDLAEEEGRRKHPYRRNAERDYLKEENLNHVQLSADDYARHRPQPRQRREEKRPITVPKPFGFDVRESTKPKTIRERKVEEMVALKKLEEEKALKHQFKAKNPPPEVIAPKYNSILERNERRRLQVKSQSREITKKNERPFSFYERDKEKHMERLNSEQPLSEEQLKPKFKAKEIPPSVTVQMFDKMMTQDKMEREERIRRNAQLSY